MDVTTECNASYPLPHSLARANKPLPVFSGSESKGKKVSVELSSAARDAGSNPASSAPERHPQSLENSLAQCKADFHIRGGKLC